jgi:hypothetical protein
VTFRLTPADYGSGVRRLAWALLPVKVIVLVTVLAFIGSVASAVLANPVLTIVLLFVSLAYAAILAWILFIRPGQQYQRRADVRSEQTICFTEAEMSLTFVSGDSRVKWSYFVGLLETKDLYVLRHPIKQMGTIVPRRAFTGPDAEARFRWLAQRIGRSQPGGPAPA